MMQIFFSDHCCISYEMSSSSSFNDIENNEHEDDIEQKLDRVAYTYRLENDKKDLFLNSLGSEEVKGKIGSLCEEINLSQSEVELDVHLSHLKSSIQTVCDQLLKKHVYEL